MRSSKPDLGAVTVLALTFLSLAPAACTTSPADEEEETDPVSEVSQGLVSYACNPRQDTGYSNGNAFAITVVTVDDDPVEVATADAFLAMAQAAERSGVTLRINSGFRTNAEQQYVYNCYQNCNCNSCNLASPPGYSNHQSGHALDLNTSSAGVYDWLAANAGAYGFKRTVPSEAWHWEWWGGGPGTKFCEGPPPVSQVTGNGTMTLVNWPDKHAEIFMKTQGGDVQHIWTTGQGDDWGQPETLDTGVACGFAAAMWPTPSAELFTPTTSGKTSHLWWSKSWSKLVDFGDASMTKLSTLTWDKHVEVFALGPDKAIWHKYFNLNTSDWTEWSSFGGQFVTGASPIRWADGHAEIFATDDKGIAQHLWWIPSSGWTTWAPLENPPGVMLATEPVPVRWPDSGSVEVFARGADDHLYHAYHNDKGWTAFDILGADTKISGVPSAVAHSTRREVEIFARDTQDKVVHLWWTGQGWGGFEPLGDQVVQSDPFGWLRADGAVEVFAIDKSGALQKTYLPGSPGAPGWSPWTAISGATGLDACLPPVKAANSNDDSSNDPSRTGVGSSVGKGGGTSDRASDLESSGCSVSALPAPSSSPRSALTLGAMFGALVLAARRRRDAGSIQSLRETRTRGSRR